MSDWTSASDLRAEAERLWRRGTTLREALGVEAAAIAGRDGVHDGSAGDGEVSGAGDRRAFPHRMKFRAPRSAELSPRFDAVRAWVREIDALEHVRVEHRTVRHRELGSNTLPASVWLDTPEAAAAFAGHARELVRFRARAAALLAHDARLGAWLGRRPHRVLELSDALPRLLRVHARLLAEPASGRHLRELDVEGVDTKFVETHRDTLGDWLDLTLDAAHIDERHRGVRAFARRYGFRDRPERLRLRSLDPDMALVRVAGVADVDTRVGGGEGSGDRDTLAGADLQMDVASVAALAPVHRNVLIVENEINYLCLPPLAATIALFGAGYGLSALGDVAWLATRRVHYWGDIDTHGFAILDELRAHLPHARSLLMDRRTLLANRAFWEREPSPARRVLTRLDAEERALHRELVENVHGESLRLEQERIPFTEVVAALGTTLDDRSA